MATKYNHSKPINSNEVATKIELIKINNWLADKLSENVFCAITHMKIEYNKTKLYKLSIYIK